MAQKTLIAYYSWSGHTKALALLLQQLTGGDLYQIEVPEDTFSADMDETAKTAQAQLASGQLPQLVTAPPAVAAYDVVLVGGPVWSGDLATPVRQFLQTVHPGEAMFAPFYTHAGTPGDYEGAFKKALAGGAVTSGFGTSGYSVAGQKDAINAWWHTV